MEWLAGVITAVVAGILAVGTAEARLRRVIRDVDKHDEEDTKKHEVHDARIVILERGIDQLRERTHGFANEMQRTEGRTGALVTELREAQKELRQDILGALSELRADFRALLGDDNSHRRKP